MYFIIRFFRIELSNYFQYISWASFHAFHTPCAQRVVDSGRIPLSYGVLRANIRAVVTRPALSHCNYIYGFVIPELLNFL
jgi:hypothetical protein